MKQYEVKKMDINQSVIATSDLNELLAVGARNEGVVKGIKKLVHTYLSLGKNDVPASAIVEVLGGL